MKIDLLDHGYIKFIEASGTGEAGKEGLSIIASPNYEVGIIEAARMSTQKGFLGWDSDAGLLAYPFNNNHDTPFEFADLVIEVQAPIMVFREWHRHRTQSYNEMSARYAPLPDLYYLPDPKDVADRADPTHRNRQQQSVASLKDVDAVNWVYSLERFYGHAEMLYQEGLRRGVPKELARLCMPVGHYTRMRAKANLRNWLAFMTLRSAPNAMKEIRVYSDALGTILSSKFPRTFALFEAERRRVAQEKRIVEIATRLVRSNTRNLLAEWNAAYMELEGVIVNENA